MTSLIDTCRYTSDSAEPPENKINLQNSTLHSCILTQIPLFPIHFKLELSKPYILKSSFTFSRLSSTDLTEFHEWVDLERHYIVCVGEVWRENSIFYNVFMKDNFCYERSECCWMKKSNTIIFYLILDLRESIMQQIKAFINK